VAKSGLNKDSIGALIKRAAVRAGLRAETLSGHSLRSGHVTQCAMNDIPEVVIMRQTGHRSTETLRKYIRHGDIFRKNSAAGLGKPSRKAAADSGACVDGLSNMRASYVPMWARP
jgi:integrase